MPLKPVPSPSTVPSADVSPLLAGLNASNLILSSKYSGITNCRRSSLINVRNWNISHSYNFHVIGSSYYSNVYKDTSNNKIINGDFSEELNEWTSGGSATFLQSDGGVCKLEEGGSITQQLALSKNKTYYICLDIYRVVRVTLFNTNDQEEILFDAVIGENTNDLESFELVFSSHLDNVSIRLENVSEVFWYSVISDVSVFPPNSSSYLTSSNHRFIVLSDLNCESDINAAFELSDKRLKDNIKPIENCLQKVIALDAVEFEWNDLQETYSGKDIGLIAQQVERIAPEIVENRENGYKAIRYEKLNAVIIGSMKESYDRLKNIIKKIAK